MEEKMIAMRDGKRIYTRIYNNGHKKTILYLHGGPGLSCYTFQHEAELLAEYMNVILIDQRGVLRSEKIYNENEFSVDTIIEDCEDLRRNLKIDRWSVLGQSFGGYLALMYEVKYPEYIEKLVFENPSFDLLYAVKSFYRKAIRILRNSGFEQSAKEIENYVLKNNNFKELVFNWLTISYTIREEVFYDKPWNELPEEHWANSYMHLQKIITDPEIYKDSLQFIKQIQCPSLLIKGEHDCVLSNEYMNLYLDNVDEAKLTVVKDCGIFIHLNKPEKYRDIVVDFVCRD
ncbi:alpha/beta fold hydrolase [Clostridium oryzae]|uniref:Proline iminopeptidase n=1 Tax=Clostridium oryzae TaxID=1450648 RepID=A0A1V4IUK5_9CLOT|nr:alpha/beta hydrolase [Clostridium oryzae]OPJ63599.1 proline iminopeptidase [Clostridium oryzae]